MAAVDGAVHKMNEWHKVWEVLKSLMRSRGLGINAKNVYMRESLCQRNFMEQRFGYEKSKRRMMNVLEMKCLKSMVVVTQMDRIRNEEIRRRVGIERELTC